MPSIQKSLLQITTLEELSQKDTPIHTMSSLVKIILTLIYIIIVISFRQGDLDGILLYACYPVLLVIIGEIPMRPLLLRSMTALPFVVFAGISNLIYHREVVLHIGRIQITVGEIELLSLILKTLLTVMVMLILVATTGIKKLSYGLSSLHLPSIFVMQLIMTYRYIEIIAEEASSMHQAYQLRAPKEKGVKLQDYGKFLGQLLLRSFDRAERVYQAMQCRGFHGSVPASAKIPWKMKDRLILGVITFPIVIFRFVDLGELIGSLFIK